MNSPPERLRPRVSVVVPFHGDAAEAERMLSGISRLRIRDGDELIVADNTCEGILAGMEMASGVSVVRALHERSSYHARNAGAEGASGEWLLFIDSDCRPPASLLDDYFSGAVDERCGVVAGGVIASSEQTSLAARYARSRRHLDESFHIETGPHPSGITANLMVRRETWRALGGFQEGVRSGADLEFCWRAQEVGWALLHRPEARVRHLHPDRVTTVFRKAVRYGAGRLWVERRYEGAFPRPRLAKPLVRAAGGALVWTLTARFERALFKAIDGVWSLADEWGYVAGDNRAYGPDRAAGEWDRTAVTFLVDAFPARTETFIVSELEAMRRHGWAVGVSSRARPQVVDRSAARSFPIDYVEDDPPPQKLRDLAWLLRRRPLACARDRLARARWAREERPLPLSALAPVARRLVKSHTRHLHVHFAAGSALDGLRLSRLIGIPYSVTAHGFDIFQEPRNLREKLEGAAFSAGTCDYTVAHLRRLVGDGRADRVQRIVMGVDSARFRRRDPYPGGRTLAAVGRYVEKKGFEVLVEAVAELERSAPVERAVIAGDGPLRGRLEELVARLGLSAVVELPRVSNGEGVRALLEQADVFVMPSVVAADGDRDSMPVVVKEALSMEVPVVASDAVGLPEIVAPGWGSLVPPGDAHSLAWAIAALLDRPAAERAAMGARGRDFVRRHCNPEIEARKLASLIAGVAASEDRYAVADRAARDREQLDHVVEQEVGRE